MPFALLRRLPTALFFIVISSHTVAQGGAAAQSPQQPKLIEMQQYSVVVEPGDPPQLTVERDGQAVFKFPVVAGLASSTREEKLSGVGFSLRETGGGAWELNATAQSSLWTALPVAISARSH